MRIKYFLALSALLIFSRPVLAQGVMDLIGFGAFNSPTAAPSVWAQIGNALSNISTLGGDPKIATLSSTRIAFAQSGGAGVAEVRTYDWDGTNWSQTGNSYDMPSFISGSNVPVIGLAALSSTRVAIADATTQELRTLDFDGTNWSQTGNALSLADTSAIGGIGMAALNSTTIAYIDQQNDKLKTFTFDGTNWSQTGNALTISSTAFNNLCLLRSNTVAMSETFNNQVVAYAWDGTDWAQTGSGYTISSLSEGTLAQLDTDKVVFFDSAGAEDLIVLNWNGSAFTEANVTQFSISAVDDASITALTSTTIAYIDETNDDLITYGH